MLHFLQKGEYETVSITCCNGQDEENDKLFGFLRSAEKCLKETNQEACVQRNLKAWCTKRKGSLLRGRVISNVCGCVDDSTRLVIPPKLLIP